MTIATIDPQFGLQTEGVTGQALGYKQRNGQLTDEEAYIFYVAKKKARADLSAEQLIPKKIGTYATDVQEAVFTAHGPLWIGDKIGPVSNVRRGTIGLIFRLNQTNYLLTNWHVVHPEEDAWLGKPARWVNPFEENGRADAMALELPPAATTNGVINLFDYTFTMQGSKYAKSICPVPLRTTMYSSDIRTVRRCARGIASCELGDVLWTVGATTGVVPDAVVSAIYARIGVSFGELGNVTLHNQIVLSRGPSGADVSRPGNSGACFYDSLNRACVLNCAGTTGDLAIGAPISDVFMLLFSREELDGWNIDQARGYLRDAQEYTL